MRVARIGEARVAHVDAEIELADAATALGLRIGSPVLVLVGGASSMPRSAERRVRALLETLVPRLDRMGAAVVDGGTAYGVMRAAGEARQAAGGAFPLVGVAVAALVLTGTDAAGTALDPGHTQFVLVPGEAWGDESPWLARFAGDLAAGARSVTLLANGGEVAWNDVRHSLELGRRVVDLAGSGRTADELAGGGTERARALLATGLVDVVPVERLSEAAEAVRRALEG